MKTKGSTDQHRILRRIVEASDQLTPKQRTLADYVARSYQKVAFMTAKELSLACKVSEATVIRFVNALGFSGYGEFVKLLQGIVNARLTLADRVQLQELERRDEPDVFRQVMLGELSNVKELCQHLDAKTFRQVVRVLTQASRVDVVGGRDSHGLAFYLAWSLQRIRPGVRLLEGTQEFAVDQLTMELDPGALVAVGMARYPNSLINLTRYAKDFGFQVVVITDSVISPLVALSDLSLIAPSQRFGVASYLSAASCLINGLVTEVAQQNPQETKRHQEKLERVYREQRIFYDLEADSTDH